MADHQALHREDLFVGLGRLDQAGQPVGFGEGVVVEQHHIFAFRRADALVHRVGKAGVACVADERVARAALVALRDGQALVRRAVVDDDQLKILLGLRPDRLDRIAQPAGAVQVRDDDARFHAAPPKAVCGAGRL